ncbi:hypothetical protein [Rhizobium sp. LjRoot254]|uniref:hypothetical protein n=1 Tax=Rhizobium sp. LjRoot254 TaxID=3342297 RepID=UPI003ECCD93A
MARRARSCEWEGTDKDGPVSITRAALVVNAKKVPVVTYWGTKGEQDKNAAAMSTIKPDS